jgi:hypothetical protein
VGGIKEMKARILIVALALAGTHATPASELAIGSFDSTGRLTFQEVPAAAAYRAEWTTNLISPTWSSNAPGIANIPASGAGTLAVTVGVVHAACFYRVVATVSNVSPTGLTNTFDLTSEDWRIVDYPFRSHATSPATSPLPFDASFGNPPGSVRVGDVYAETGIAAPAQFLGNKLSFYGGSLAYDIYIRYTDDTAYPAMVLNDGTMSLYYDTPSPPLNAWQHRSLPLSQDGWKVSSSGVAATEAQFKAVLSNLVGLYIYTEWHTGPDDTSVDNISMTPP